MVKKEGQRIVSRFRKFLLLFRSTAPCNTRANIRSFFLSLPILLILAGPAFGQSWQMLDAITDSVCYVDTSSVKHGAHTSTAWFKRVYPTVMSDGGITRDHEIFFTEFDSKGRIKIRSVKFYLGLNYVDGFDFTAVADWDNPAPGTMGDVMIRYITRHYRNSRKTNRSLTSVEQGNWKNRKNWRRLTRGMKRGQVAALLGEPTRIEGGFLTYWFYTGSGILGAHVSFGPDGLNSWTEP